MIINGPATAGQQKPTDIPRTGLRGAAFRGYHWLLAGFLLLGVAQIFLAGLGVFSLQDKTLGEPAAIRRSRRTAPSGSAWPVSRCSSWCWR